MTDTQLKYFITIVELGSFTEAALELNISQSSVSKQIMQLEDELGVTMKKKQYLSYKSVLNLVFKYAYSHNLINSNPVSKLKAIFLISDSKNCLYIE